MLRAVLPLNYLILGGASVQGVLMKYGVSLLQTSVQKRCQYLRKWQKAILLLATCFLAHKQNCDWEAKGNILSKNERHDHEHGQTKKMDCFRPD